MILPIQGPLPSQQEIINLIVEKPPAIVQIAPELTVEEKIKQNFYKCNTDTHYIRADNATCLAKPITTQQPARKAATEPIRASQGGSYANDMSYGYCTWYVKNIRSDLPTGLGNANTWYTRAQAMGLPVGSSPRVGAVATTTSGGLGHVAYVLAVSDGMVYVTEMNVRGWNIENKAWYPASNFLYIY